MSLLQDIVSLQSSFAKETYVFREPILIVATSYVLRHTCIYSIDACIHSMRVFIHMHVCTFMCLTCIFQICVTWLIHVLIWYTCIYIYIYICTYIYSDTHIYIHSYMYTDLCSYIWVMSYMRMIETRYVSRQWGISHCTYVSCTYYTYASHMYTTHMTWHIWTRMQTLCVWEAYVLWGGFD